MISNPKSTNLKSLKNRKKQLERINKKDNAKKDRQRKNILNLKISIGKRYSSNRLNPSIARSRGQPMRKFYSILIKLILASCSLMKNQRWNISRNSLTKTKQGNNSNKDSMAQRDARRLKCKNRRRRWSRIKGNIKKKFKRKGQAAKKIITNFQEYHKRAKEQIKSLLFIRVRLFADIELSWKGKTRYQSSISTVYKIWRIMMISFDIKINGSSNIMK